MPAHVAPFTTGLTHIIHAPAVPFGEYEVPDDPASLHGLVPQAGSALSAALQKSSWVMLTAPEQTLFQKTYGDCMRTTKMSRVTQVGSPGGRVSQLDPQHPAAALVPRELRLFMPSGVAHLDSDSLRFAHVRALIDFAKQGASEGAGAVQTAPVVKPDVDSFNG